MSNGFDSGRWFAVTALFVAFSILPAHARAEGSAKPAASDPDAVPDGTPDELLEFIKKRQQPRRETGSRAERMAKRKQAAAAIVAAADKILDSEADDATVAAALVAELEALPLLDRLGDKQAGAKQTALVEQYKNDPRPAVAQAVKLRDLARQVDELEQAAAPDTEELKELAALVKEYLSADQPNEATAALAYRVGKLVEKAGSIELIVEVIPEMAQLLIGADDLKCIVQGAKLGKSAADQLTTAGRTKEAIALYQTIAAGLNAKNDPQLAGAAEQLLGTARQLDLVGHSLDIEGKLVDGGEVDWASF
ncbi:MAG TPA: hypothetical protein VGX76_21865, partial [Pirellulales bacterium]|nr:hypothetical protein [Pirellulales bacterium]